MADVVINVGAVSAITAGTGLTGGTITGTGTIAADFGTTAGTICQGNDARLTAPVAPLAHASTHTAAGSDPLTLSQSQITSLSTDLAAKVATTRQVIAGTGLGGGGALSADVTLNVSYGTSGTTACVGNDARLSNARTPSTHASTHGDGQSDAITIAQSQVTSLVSALAAKALGATTMTAGTGLTGGGDLSANRSFAVAYGSTSTTATVGNDARLSFVANGSGATTRTLQNKLRDVVNVKDYGAIGDGTLHTVAEWIPSRYANLTALQVDYPFVTGTGYSIDLAAINKAILLFSQSRLSPTDTPPSGGTSLSDWGMGKIYIPRGNYVTNDKIYVSSGSVGDTVPLSSIGLLFQGDGMWATNIIYNQSSGDMCHLKICLDVYFADMSFINTTAAARNTWTSNAFRIDPAGGGKLFQMDRCYMRNFHIGINLEGTVNNDTNRINNCWSEDQNIWLYTRNSQAIINEINSCSMYDTRTAVFDVAGFGYTTVNNCDIIVSGTVLNLAYGAGLSGAASQYTFINTKMELWNETTSNTNGTTKIVVTENNQDNMTHVRMIGCGISGTAPDASIFQFDLQGGNTTVDVNGGMWGDANDTLKIRTRAQLGRGLGSENGSWVKFENCTTIPSKTISRTSGSDVWAQQLPVIFKNNRGSTDICMYGPNTANNLSAPVGGGLDHNYNSRNDNGNITFADTDAFPTNSKTHVFLTNGQRVLVQKIYAIATTGGATVTEARLQAFSDSGYTNQIGSTVTKTTSLTAPWVMEITVPAGTFVTDGVWVRVWAQSPAFSTYGGMVYVDTVSA